MKKIDEYVKKTKVVNEKNNIKNTNNENEKNKKKKKKKKIPKGKIEKEENIEITEKKELLDNIKINNYNETGNKLISKITSYIELREVEIQNDLLNKYYVDKKTPFFYIDINIYKCIYDTFFFPLKDKNLDNKDNLFYENSLYFYNVINSNCLNVIFYFLKEFFREHELEYFENCCEIMQLTYLLFFILLIDYHSLNDNIKIYCIENFKMLFKIKNYLYEKYIKYINKGMLNKFILLNKIENNNKKNDFFIFETKIINEILNTNKIEFENMTIYINSSKKLEKFYFINLVIKNKSYEYINDILLLDLFKIHIFTNKNSSISSKNKSPIFSDEENSIITVLEERNLFHMEELNNLFSYIYEIEIPSNIYKNQKLDVFYIESNNNVKNTKIFQVEMLQSNKRSLVNKILLENQKTEVEFEKKEDNTEEDYINENGFINSNANKENFINKNDTNKKKNDMNESNRNGNYEKKNKEIINVNESDIYRNFLDVNDIYEIKFNYNDIKKNSIYEDNKINLNNNKNENYETNLVKVASEQFMHNNKIYLKIYSNKIGNYYINLSSINNLPYTFWKIKYENNNVIIKLKSKIINEFIFHINNKGIVLLDNGIDVLKDIYNCNFDICTLLFLMKKKGINFLIENVEIKKIKKENYNLSNEEIEENIINDILLCFRFINFYSSNHSSDKSKIIIKLKENKKRLKQVFEDPLYIEYEDNFCKIAKITKDDSEKMFIKNLSKHKSALFCLFELCELVILNSKKEKKNIYENGKHENNEEDNKNEIMFFQNFLINIFSYNNIEQISEIMKENDNLKKNSLQIEEKDKFSNDQYNDLFEVNETIHNLYWFLKLTKIISLTNI
ncbi:conserved Plasmodium protein, unknown function [Plasmodium relictum]|uniref:Uncharacterized protein n=1 Tax=Plasmodium relictum TaxID=85471 RepID=A0A1J1HCH4_PLARL|nr:conserved Plasmodium protein, unknown function [Plasmodium relictum]CRH01281.1 conserved Plasmodium protein, unknown function [Plasmodium relictum]